MGFMFNFLVVWLRIDVSENGQTRVTQVESDRKTTELL